MKLSCPAENIELAANVPGDITYALYKGGVIEDPYFGMNYRKLGWIFENDFVYSTEITVTREQFNAERLELRFYGVDTFSEVYLNGEYIGSTENMFLKHSFSVKGIAKCGRNLLEVRMCSTMARMKAYDCKNYFATFNLPRIFIRKAQCHFGWDWAPNLPGYGIWQPVCIAWGDALRLKAVRYVADTEGNIVFHVETEGLGQDTENAELAVHLAAQPFASAESGHEMRVKLKQEKQFVCMKVNDCKLWWPSGYGEANLYPFTVTVGVNGKISDEYRANCAFRTVSIEEKPSETEALSFVFKVNDTRIYVRGSNWVPIECFTGEVKDDKYERLIAMAQSANFNLLRVWGGGIYEKDIFYDICDRSGIMVWQDFMFACADIPEEDPAFLENVLKECKYQILRLINHPSLVYWCGGNEKTGTYGKLVSHGDFFCDNILHGLVKTLDPTRPYIRQSPFSHTEIGNDMSSGESHCNSCEESLEKGIRLYRRLVAEKKPSFISECAVMGPSVGQTMRTMFPEEKLWPINEYWRDRFMDNPYASYVLPFADRQLKFASELYGECTDFDDFIAKANSVHAEMLQAEIDYARSRKWACAGFLNWMYSDIWPSGTWAVVDYYLRPKQAFYRMKACFAPVRAAFVSDRKGEITLQIFCDGSLDFNGTVEYGEKTPEGKSIWVKKTKISAVSDQNLTVGNAACTDEKNYLFARLTDQYGERLPVSLYSPSMWGGVPFESAYTVRCAAFSGKRAEIEIRAESFAKGVYLSFTDNGVYRFSENFVDIEAGERALIVIDGDSDLDLNKLQYCDFANPHFRSL